MQKLRLLVNTKLPYTGHRRARRPDLKVIDGGQSVKNFDPSSVSVSVRDPDALHTGLRVLEATLVGEDWFLDTVRSAALTHLRAKPGKAHATLSKDEFPVIGSSAGHDHLIDLSQFYFAMHALDCTDEVSISRFIQHHNTKIDQEIASGQARASNRELEKARFSGKRAAQVTDTVKHYQRLVFSVSELGSLLITMLSPKMTENLIADLLLGGLMRRRGVGDEDIPRYTDPRRVLVEPTELFLDAYVQSLVRTHQMLTVE